jgi:hypothetical protein
MIFVIHKTFLPPDATLEKAREDSKNAADVC